MNKLEKILKLKIDDYFCISLKKEGLERRKKTIQIFKNLNIPIKFYLPEKNKNSILGCLESHLYCIKYAKKHKLKNIFICEDDIEFLNFNKYQNLKIPENFDMFYLGYHINKGYKYDINLLKLESGLTTHAYIINEKIYDIVIENILKNNWNLKENLNEFEKPFFNNDLLTIDKFYAKEIHDKRKNSYAIYPLLCNQRPEFSIIENQFVDYTDLLLTKSNFFYNIKNSKFRGIFKLQNQNLFNSIKELLKTLNFSKYDYILINNNKKEMNIMKTNLIFPNEPNWDIWFIEKEIFYIRMTFLSKEINDLYIISNYSNNLINNYKINKVIHNKPFLCIYTKNKININTNNFEILKYSKNNYSFFPNHILITDDPYIFLDVEIKNVDKILFILNDIFPKKWNDLEMGNLTPHCLFYNFIEKIDYIFCNNIEKTCNYLNIEKNNRILLIDEIENYII